MRAGTNTMVCMNPCGRLARSALVFRATALLIILEVATSHRKSAETFTKIFRNEQQYQPPLAVVRANQYDDDAPFAPEIKIFAEDPQWAKKVRTISVRLCHAAVGACIYRTWMQACTIRHTSRL